MITYAQIYKTEVEALLAKFQATRDARFYAAYPYYSPGKIADDTWSKLHLVAVHDGKVQGFFSASIDRNALYIDGIGMVKFCEGHEEEMAADAARIFKFLLSHFRSVCWNVVATSPLVAIYDKIALEHGGRRVGLFEKTRRLPTGELADSIEFQVVGAHDPDGSTLLPADWSI